MKLRKQAPAKTLIALASAGLLLAFYVLVKSDPQTGAQVRPPVDYDRFFAPRPGEAANEPPATPVLPHTRTRAS
jgi:hypothetical protein